MTEKQRVMVQSMHAEAEQIIRLGLTPTENQQLVPFEAGGHLDVFLSKDLVRPYSLMNNPKQRNRYEIAILHEKESRGGSKYIHNKLRVGDFLEVSKPRNTFPLMANISSHVFVAGGIGITPFLSMVHEGLEKNQSMTLYYCGRSPEKTAFAEQLKKQLGDNLVLHFDYSDRSKSLDLGQVVRKHAGSQFYCCGPKSLMQSFLDEAKKTGESVLIEDFNPAKQISEKVALNEEGYEIILANSNISLKGRSNQTILEVLRESNIEVESSCEAGVCRACVVGYLEGTPIHNDVVLMPDEQKNSVAICVAGCSSKKIILDL